MGESMSVILLGLLAVLALLAVLTVGGIVLLVLWLVHRSSGAQPTPAAREPHPEA
jgi:hypothetical protein